MPNQPCGKQPWRTCSPPSALEVPYAEKTCQRACLGHPTVRAEVRIPVRWTRHKRGHHKSSTRMHAYLQLARQRMQPPGYALVLVGPCTISLQVRVLESCGPAESLAESITDGHAAETNTQVHHKHGPITRSPCTVLWRRSSSRSYASFFSRFSDNSISWLCIHQYIIKYIAESRGL